MDKKLGKIFTQISHHNNMSIIFMLQNAFHQSGNCMDIKRNASHVVLFNSPQDMRPVSTALRSVIGDGNPLVKKVVQELKETPHGYIMADVAQRTACCARLRSKIFPDEDNVFYVNKDCKLDPQFTKDNPRCRTEEI